MPRTQTRKHRVGAEIQRLLNELLLSDAKDPRLEGARVSDVEVSGDLGLATVYFNLIDPEEDPADVKEGFERARGFLRSRVGEALQLRRVPELRFRHDTSAQRAIELGRLIDQSRPRRPNESSD
jgi:ribosome-binding factor A